MSHKVETAYLHIGLEKTGTTSVQAFLNRNRAALAEIGYLIPSSIGVENQKKFAAYAFNNGSTDIAVTSMGIPEGGMESFRTNVRTGLAKEFDQTTADKAIISTEDLSRLFTHEEIQRAVSLIAEFARTVRVIVFLRRQDLLAVSRYYSLIIGGSRQGSVFPSATDGGPRYYAYYQNLSRWIDTVGADNVTAVRFPERPRDEGFDAVTAFCRTLGLNPEIYDRVDEKNISLDAVNQLIIRSMNTDRDTFDQGEVNRLRERLLAYNDKSLWTFVSEAQAREFHGRYAEGNRKLFEALGLPQDFFGDDFSMYPDKNMRDTYREMAIRRLVRILMESPELPATAG